MKFICQYCGKEFEAKKSSKRKYCCRECSSKDSVGKRRRNKQVLVKCAECGKEEYVPKSRAKKYVCCSIECLSKYNSKRYSQKIEKTCPICGKTFYVKPFIDKRSKDNCCSIKCASILRKDKMKGDKNHQYGLNGKLNKSYKGEITTKKNGKYWDIFVYCPECPSANRNGRVTKHRLEVMKNWEKYPSEFFEEVNGWHILKKGYDVHHIDLNHMNNDINNLQIVTKKEHTKIHNEILNKRSLKYENICNFINKLTNEERKNKIILKIIEILDEDIK